MKNKLCPKCKQGNLTDANDRYHAGFRGLYCPVCGFVECAGVTMERLTKRKEDDKVKAIDGTGRV